MTAEAPAQAPADDPWTLPVAMKRSSFVPLHPADADCNVEVDPAGAGSFFTPRPELLAHTDHQLIPDGNARGRLGSGRAVFLGGRYLKGVGRTPLAANWGVAGEERHSSGHLLPTAAAREYLVSRYLERAGCGDAIVACTGLLARPLPPGGERAVVDSMPHPLDEEIATIDLRYQAISVKRGGFCRFSNFTWSLHHVEARANHVGELILRFHRRLWPDAPLAEEDCTPRRFVADLAAAIERGFDNCRRFLAAGVFWGLVDNNFTADGRFLDLEVPVVLGGPTFGVVTEGRQAGALHAGSRWVGLEAVGFAHNVRLFLADLRAQLRFLIAAPVLHAPIVHRFAAAIVRELDRVIPASHVARSPKALARWTETMIADEFALGPRARQRLREVVTARVRYFAESYEGEVTPMALRYEPLRLAQYVPGKRLHFHHPDWVPPLPKDALERAERWNAQLEIIDGALSLDDWFARIRRAECELS